MLLWMLGTAASCAGCLPRCDPTTADRAAVRIGLLTSHQREVLIARTRSVFERGVFYKPRDGSMPGRVFELAPLVVHEVPPGGPTVPAQDRFGALRADDAGKLVVDATHPTIYTAWATALVAGRTCEQIVFVWWCRARGTSAALDAPVSAWRGIRLTLDAEGFPIVSEWLSPDAGAAVLFVSQSLERAAAEAFGPPLPGRRFSIERGVDEQPDLVVARVLDDGPQPMGPFVYIGAETRDATTLLCRCMPSQVRRFVEDVYYDLRPLADLEAVNASLRDPEARLPTCAAGLIPASTDMADRTWLQRALRFPFGQSNRPL